ncbi:hypothetical protein Golob_021950 [Gossypium lobatum]|uniref:Reverse transcriptase domain-containing protein n=1 Tax=Gossypium lobatum TaxID=34289 RepID=A0A7J8LF38_9ROSI|nr:hypothetical protein [Gossypium lobatum]
MERVRQSCGFANGIDVDSNGSRRRLCLAWRGDVTITLQSFSKRNWFTWEMGNLPETIIQERLDRGVATEEWMSMFPERFKFETLWVFEESFADEIEKDERYWEQRARVNWLKLGDKNTVLFHNLATQRRRRNFIRKMHHEDGREMKVRWKIKEDNQWLTARYTMEEIRSVFSGMGPTKTPAMDVSSINTTNIVLILKIANPSNITHFQTISLCNVLYKLMANAIANRFREVLDKCIDVAQSTFVLGRLISDNVLLAYEILHSLKQKGLSSLMRLARKEGLLRRVKASKSGLQEEERGMVASVLGMRSSNDPECYLGLSNKSKSVWAIKGLLKSGLYWRVGTGDQISIWDDLCISGADADKLSNISNNEGIKLVSDLIDATNRTWKFDIIANTFNADIVRKILQIPLVEAAHDDFQVWRGEPSGEFSVRSSYKLLQEANLGPSNNIQTEIKDFYRKLWNLHLPSKIIITI